MTYFQRKITPALHHALARNKSILLLGPRQTGKSTLIKYEVKPDLEYSFIQPNERQRYEVNPEKIVFTCAFRLKPFYGCSLSLR